MDSLTLTRVFAKPGSTFTSEVAQRFTEIGAVVVGPPALDPELHEALTAEAGLQIDESGWRLEGAREAGEISQNNRRAHLGPVARAYLSSDAVLSWLYLLTGEKLAPSWSATCYTRYAGPWSTWANTATRPMRASTTF